MRLPPRGVCRFLCWHVLKLEFWHFARPKLNLGFVFASVFAVFSSKKMPQPAGCTVQKHAQLSISHRFFSVFSCVCRISHRFLQCFGHLSTFCTCRLRLAFVFQLCAGVGGGCGCDLCFLFLLLTTFFCYVVARCSGGEGGGWGGDDVHANATCVFFLFTFFCYVVVRYSGGEGGGWGGVMTSMRMRVVFSFCFVDLLLVVLVVISGYLLLGFPHILYTLYILYILFLLYIEKTIYTIYIYTVYTVYTIHTIHTIYTI